MDLKRCGRCQLEKSIEEFNWRREERGQRDNMCRPCRAAYHHEHYVANRQRYVDQARERKQRVNEERVRFLLEFFAANPCADCGEDDPVVLEFDHRGDKSFNVGSALPYRAWPTILAEIAKCDVVCANCHRLRTARRAQSLRFRLTSGRRDSNPY